jgi:hypothetical protein
MRTRFTPQFVELCFSATLCSFWRRKTLRRFLEQCGVPVTLLATWHDDETKRDFLERLFAELPEADTGRVTVLKLAKSLAEQKDFPDLRGWEDSELKVRNATEAAEALRHHLDAQESQIEGEKQQQEARKRHHERQQAIAQSQQTLKALDDRLRELSSELGSQQAGYGFQDWFFDLANHFEIQNRRPYDHAGRQIDGSLTIDGTTYLVELKFTTGQTGAPEIDVFRRKVDTKADNTMGIFVSISGYSSVAVSEASGPKTTLLLFDYNHLYLTLSGAMTLAEVVERSRRHSSQTGEAYLKASKIMA